MDLDPLRDQLGRHGETRGWGLGSVDRQSSGGVWRIPAEFEIREAGDGNQIIWWDRRRGRFSHRTIERFGPRMGMREATDDGELFGRFLQLGNPNATDQPVEKRALRFAERYGMFPVCTAHGQPAYNCPGLHVRGDGDPPPPAIEADYPTVDQVKDVSGQVRTLIQVAIHLRDGEQPTWSDCLQVLRIQDPDITSERKPYQSGREALEAALSRSEGHAEAWLSRAVNQWIRHGDLHPELHWTASGPRKIAIAVESLLGAIARHIFLTVTGDFGIALCDGCRRIFTPEKRKPKQGQFTWCYDCGEGSNYRIAKRVSARRRRNDEG